MNVAFPWMGNIHIPLAALFRALGARPVIPPPPSPDVVARGVRLAPELMCIPFKITLGNFTRALEMGADTLIYSSGTWSCRFGYYHLLQADILRRQGYRFEVIPFRGDRLPRMFGHVRKLSSGRTFEAVRRIARAVRIGWLKSTAVDTVERLTRRIHPIELEPGATTRLSRSLLSQLDRTDSPRETAALRRGIPAEFARIPIDQERRPLRVKVLGESFCILEPTVSLNLVERLGALGVFADPFLTTHRWLGFHSLRVGETKRRQLLRAARPYWRYNTGGEDENAVAYMIDAARSGFDGVIHLHPFACMPGTVVGPTLARVSHDCDIPLLDISLDEQTAEAGLYTRVEAFLSVIEKRRKRGLLHPAARSANLT